MGGLKHWRSGEVIAERYKVERLIGRGGLGTVYLVVHRGTGHRYAAKRVPVDFGDETERKQSVLDELRYFQTLSPHPQLVSLHFFREFPGELVLFLEYLPGGSLADALTDGRTKTLPEILAAAIQIADGLSVLHEAGLCHGDVRPSNVLRDVNGTLKLADFGLTSPTLGTHWKTEHSQRYRSPEQALGRRLSAASDIWSWATTVLELFNGSAPWIAGEIAPDFLSQFIAKRSAVKDRPVMPLEMARILSRCFKRDPSSRWPSMKSVATDIRRIYRKQCGSEFLQPLHPTQSSVLSSDVREDTLESERCRIGPCGARWRDPENWLRSVNGEKQQTKAELPQASNPAAQATIDVTRLRRVEQLLLNATGQTPERLNRILGQFYFEMAAVQWTAGDIPAAIESITSSVARWNALWSDTRDETVGQRLARALHRQAWLHLARGDHRGAAECLKEAIQQLESSNSSRHEAEYWVLLADSYARLAVVREGMPGDENEDALLFDQSADAYRRAMHEAPSQSTTFSLANICLHHASFCDRRELHQQGIDLRGRARTICEKEQSSPPSDELRLLSVLAQIDQLNSITFDVTKHASEIEPASAGVFQDLQKRLDTERQAENRKGFFESEQDADAREATFTLPLLSKEEQNRLGTAFRSIVQRDATRDWTKGLRVELTAVLPIWCDTAAHAWDMLCVALERLRKGLRHENPDDTIMQVMVVFEYIIQSCRTLGAENPNTPPDQQVADAWYHKGTIHRFLAMSFPDESSTRREYLRAATNCIEIACLVTEFVQPQFLQLRDTLAREGES